MFYPHVSVDCVLLGTNEDKLCVLLVERQVAGSNEKHYKLPGSLIYESEDLDTAAYRVLNEATGLKRVALKQFRSFGSPARTKNKEDVQWLENASKMKITRIVTVAYLALCKFGKKMTMGEMSDTLIWAPVNFHKKMTAMEYVVQTDEVETGVNHRAARYYRFDKVKYNKLHSKFNKI